MNFKRYANPSLFLEKVEPFLLKNEAVHNLPLGILKRLAQNGDHSFNSGDPFMAVYTNNVDSLRLILLMTPPHHLIMVGDPLEEEELEQVISDLHSLNVSVPSVIGAPELVEPFAEKWAKRTSRQTEVEMAQRIFRLDKVIPPHKTEGTFRPAESQDKSLLTKWILAFDQEAIGGTLTRDQAEERAERGINEPDLYVWENNGRVVSMASGSRPTENGITISLVYTPPEERGKGYASHCVAQLSRFCLNIGYHFCTLYTDLSNPVSNKIYQQIGYQPVGDSIVIKFN
ncbi:GNAT family N-acetyltransferase [Pullulanibacillus sp. KACC 23026]|uniref:GNAT family N-acetyltransferase n=1 Tax=Pullulanibacillus sp. KACC 23026 TaxID=3028315 RepID=UPI0023B1102A|nr:GNAT family N-acetyltransferase [Pullulanibacillus sp. KACC 23026]WEG10833.1 GNAT family N-acetyltransferase [Pullulanibacillus sp. KACC 23026]